MSEGPAPASSVGCTRGHAPSGGLLRPAASIGAPTPLPGGGRGSAPRGLTLGRIGRIDLVSLSGLVLVAELVSLSRLVVELVSLSRLVVELVRLIGLIGLIVELVSMTGLNVGLVRLTGLIVELVGLIGPVVELVGLIGPVVIVVSLTGLIVELVGLTSLIGVAVNLAGLVDGDGVGLLLVAAVSGFLVDVGLGLPSSTAQQRASQLLLRAQQALSRLEHRITEGGHGVLELALIAW
jgi:hypothetical protein